MSSTAIDLILGSLSDGWVTRIKIFEQFRHRYSFSTLQKNLAQLTSEGTIWVRMEARGARLEPSYTLARSDVSGIVIPRRDRSVGLSCPCCGRAMGSGALQPT